MSPSNVFISSDWNLATKLPRPSDFQKLMGTPLRKTVDPATVL
jgi:hypothetical protein